MVQKNSIFTGEHFGSIFRPKNVPMSISKQNDNGNKLYIGNITTVIGMHIEHDNPIIEITVVHNL